MANYHDDGSERATWDHSHPAKQCVITDLATLTGEAPEGFIEDCNEYLSVFAAPIKGDHDSLVCLHCGEALTGFMASLFGRGGFEWGLAHGEGHCRACHWPARAFHDAKNKKGEGLFTLRPFVLQYLPDFEAEAAARRASVDTRPKDEDALAASLASGAVGDSRDAQNPEVQS